MEKDLLAVHETLDAHEILNFKTICLLRSKLMQGLCFDNELKSLMQKDVDRSIMDINEIVSLYKQSQLLH